MRGMRGPALVCAVGVVLSCSSDDASQPDASTDATTNDVVDAATKDAPLDVIAKDASEAGADAGTTWNDITNAANWSICSLGPTVSYTLTELQGGTFDGRYVYLASALPGSMARYDTTQTFCSGSSWIAYDLTPVDATKSFAGAVFDGKGVTFVPVSTGHAVRYDTSGTFNASGSWTKHDYSNLTAEKTFGGVFDGKYLYVVPNSAGVVVRSDTTDAGAWDSYDLAGLDAGASKFATAGFDGKYVYLVPQNGSNALVARYDTTAAFASPGAWTTYDLAPVSAQARDFAGAVFDGRWMYFVPYKDQANAYAGRAVRYDTTMPFASASSWEAFDTTTADANALGFVGGEFDGRYVYFSPYGHPTATFGGTTIRYDTTGAFTDKNSWASFDMTKLDVQAHAMLGVVYDGRYLYYIPGISGIVARFDTKNPASLPKPKASFF